MIHYFYVEAGMYIEIAKKWQDLDRIFCARIVYAFAIYCQDIIVDDKSCIS